MDISRKFFIVVLAMVGSFVLNFIAEFNATLAFGVLTYVALSAWLEASLD